MIKYFIFAILFFSLSPAYSYSLQWNIPLQERIEQVKTANIHFLINSQLQRTFEERNIIDLTCYQKENNASHVRGVFSVFRREAGERVFLLQEQDKADFIIEPNGHFIVQPTAVMPNLRHIPTFPEKEVQPKTSWSSAAELLIDSFPVRLNLQLTVDYTLTAVEKKDTETIGRIDYVYTIKKDLTQKKLPPDMPKKILGKNKGVLFWDLEQNTPIKSYDTYQIVFFFIKPGSIPYNYEFRMNIETDYKKYKVVTKQEKEKAKQELAKEIPKESGIDVDTNEKGLVLRMGEVLFNFNSDALRPDTRSTLDKVIQIIKQKYPDREIIVEGHTDSTGNRKYNKELSTRRAQSVAEHIKSHMQHDKLSYQGYGEDKPIADNNSKEGRQKNRRVEIIIKLN